MNPAFKLRLVGTAAQLKAEERTFQLAQMVRQILARKRRESAQSQEV